MNKLSYRRTQVINQAKKLCLQIEEAGDTFLDLEDTYRRIVRENRILKQLIIDLNNLHKRTNKGENNGSNNETVGRSGSESSSSES